MKRRRGDNWAAPAAFCILLWAIYRTAKQQRDSFSFRNKVVVITGGSRGLGLAMARRFAQEGARLALIARDSAELDRAVADLRKTGCEAISVVCDVKDQASVRHAISEIANRFGTIDVLINDAGIIQVGPLENMTQDDFEDAMAVNAWGAFYTITAAFPYLPRPGGRIVNIASIGGKIAVPHLTPYSMSKFALVGLSDAFRAELAKDGIAVTTVCPGLMRTGSHLNAYFKGQHKREFTWFSISDTIPGFSISVQSAANQIVEACRKGRPSLTITVQAKLAIIASALMPNLTARVLALVNRLLPKPAPHDNELRPGWKSRTAVSPSVFTRLGDRAAEEFNELRGRDSVYQ